MSHHSTREKVRLQSRNARINLGKAMNNLLQLAGMANERSAYINDNIPEIIAALEFIIETMEKFDEGL